MARQQAQREEELAQSQRHILALQVCYMQSGFFQLLSYGEVSDSCFYLGGDWGTWTGESSTQPTGIEKSDFAHLTGYMCWEISLWNLYGQGESIEMVNGLVTRII